MLPIDIADLTDQVFTLTPRQGLGIPVALVGAVFLALGAQLQHRGVGKVEVRLGGKARGLSRHQLVALLTRPSWLIGTVLLSLAVVFQLFSLYLAPLIVVQPLGAVALVISTGGLGALGPSLAAMAVALTALLAAAQLAARPAQAGALA